MPAIEPQGPPMQRGATPEAKQRQARALELHLAGVSYSDIARTIGFRHASTAKQAVRRELALHAHKFTDEDNPADTELARLDKMLAGLWPKARRGDVTAVDRVLQIEERRRLVTERETAKEAEKQAASVDAPRTGLSDFEKRLREREHRATDTRRAASG